MGSTFNEEFSRLTADCRAHIRAGQIDLYSADLKKMARLLNKTGRNEDALKMLIPAFYIDLSGFGRAPYVDRAVPDMLKSIASDLNLNDQKLCKVYSEMIKPDFISKHAMSISDSLYLFRLCIEGKVEQVEYVLSRI